MRKHYPHLLVSSLPSSQTTLSPQRTHHLSFCQVAVQQNDFIPEFLSNDSNFFTAPASGPPLRYRR